MPEAQAHVRASGSTRLAVREYFAGETKNAERIQKFNLGLTDDDDLPPYVHQDYPKAMYSPDSDPIVVQNASEEREQQQEGYYSSLAEMLHATANGDDGDEGDGDDEDEILVAAEGETEAIRRPAKKKRRRRPSRPKKAEPVNV